jgi:hypothetical protein
MVPSPSENPVKIISTHTELQQWPRLELHNGMCELSADETKSLAVPDFSTIVQQKFL